MNRRKTNSVIAFLVITLCCVSSARGQALVWFRQLGTSGGLDSGLGVASDGLGGVYATGRSESQAFVSKYNTGGTVEWTRQLESEVFTVSHAVSADGLGSVYISGSTADDLGAPNAGRRDAFVRKYDTNGTLAWTRQFGTSEWDESTGVSADGLGNVYVSGITSSLNVFVGTGFVSKYNDGGTLEWTRQTSLSNDDVVSGVSADGLGGVYVTGRTGGFTDGQAFVSKYDDSGTLDWTRFSTNAENTSVSADGLGNVYVSGRTTFNQGESGIDAFVSKYDSSGTLEWTQQLKSDGVDLGGFLATLDVSESVSADGLGNVYITGFVNGWSGLAITPIPGDAFIAKYDATGTLKWTRQFGNYQEVHSRGVSADGLGNVYISGSTRGNQSGTNAGGAFVGKYVVPEPSGISFAIIAFVSMFLSRRFREVVHS